MGGGVGCAGGFYRGVVGWVMLSENAFASIGVIDRYCDLKHPQG